VYQIMASEEGIPQVFLRLRGKLARAVLGMVPPREVEDIVQETYVRACQMGNTGKIREPQAFLFKVARNLALDYIKCANTRLVVSVENLDEPGGVDSRRLNDETFDKVVSNDEFSEFCDAVRQLPPQRRRAFVLKKVYGYTQREIAAEMQISTKTVERHISLGMENCLEYFDKSGHVVKNGGAMISQTISPVSLSSRKGRRS